MKPSELARKECSCYLSDGICLGVDAFSEPFYDKYGICKGGQPCDVDKEMCRYFERTIFPLAKNDEKYNKAVRSYHKIHNCDLPNKICMRCDNPFYAETTKKKYCPECTEKRKLKANKEAQDKWRKKNA